MLLFFYKEWMISCMEETVTLRLVSLSFLPEETQYKAKGDTYILASQIALHWCQHCRARVRDTYELGKVAVKYCFQIF